MEYLHFAAIDIGSNAVRLLIKRLDDGQEGRFSKDVLLRVPLRLGQDVFTKGYLSDTKVEELVSLMRAYKIVMEIYKVRPENCRFCATASLREASNRDMVVERIRHEIGFDVDIIDGFEEAAIVCAGSSPGVGRRLVYVDVGGGSTEISIVCDGVTYSRRSFPIGTVKIINGLVDDKWREELRLAVKAMLLDFSSDGSDPIRGAVIVGAGGNISKLFSMAQERDTDEMTLTLDTLRSLYNKMAPMSVDERMIVYRLKADRADVIVPAAEIFIVIAEALGIEEIEIPTNGLADGIVADIWNKKKNRDK